nr:unnamed protein product [Callosobruchus analis]
MLTPLVITFWFIVRSLVTTKKRKNTLHIETSKIFL